MNLKIKSIIILLIITLFLSGCDSSYNFEENSFDSNDKLDSNNKLVNDDSNNMDENQNKNSQSNKYQSENNKNNYDDDDNNNNKDSKNDYESKTTNLVKDLFSQFEVNENSIKFENTFSNLNLNVDLEIVDEQNNLVCTWQNKIILDKYKNEIEFDGNCNLNKSKTYTLIIKSEYGTFKFEFKPTQNNGIENEQEKDDNIKYELKVNYDEEDGQVELSWDRTDTRDGFKYYKVVHSTTNSDLKYPEDGYIKYITNPDETHFVDEDRNEQKAKFKDGINYYRITYVYENEKIHSNVVTVFVGEETEDEQEEDIEYKDDYKLEASYDGENDNIKLEWEETENRDDFEYYKVVHSTTNSNLKYPEDGYITYIDDKKSISYLDNSNFEDGINYYRITYVYKNEKIHSNVITMYINKSNNLDVENQTQEQITTNLEVVQIYAHDTSDGVINGNNSDTIIAIIRLGSSSSPINYQDLKIKLDTNQASEIKSFTNKTVMYGEYNLSYISNSGVATTQGYISTGDLVEISFKPISTIFEEETASIRFLIENDSIIPIQITTPSVMTQTTTYLYP